ncbi:ABC transporter substrate-binding protein [Agaribacterium sp. ZY112]|uniref:ABC transporter substrate-binding protein n=1 Tax=Agaribacterium sp. ZY112 TaxID=3233574 RepID=UPI00352501FC
MPRVTNSIVRLAISALALLLSTSISAKQHIQIATLINNGKHRTVLHQLERLFEQRHPDVELDFVMYSTHEYEAAVPLWLEQGDGPDLMFWYGGQRVDHFAKQGQLKDISDFWKEHKLIEQYPQALIDSVSYEQGIYAIPVSSLYSGLYYNTKVFEKYQIKPPTTWQETLDSCKILRKNNVDLFNLGSKTAWLTHGWFDYINLRVNGLTFHRELLSGKISFTDPRVKDSLSHWKELLVNQCFNANHQAYDKLQAFPRMVHGFSAMTMADSTSHNLPQAKLRDIDVVEFPQIKEGIPNYTLAPIDVFIVPAYINMTAEMEDLLLYIANDEFQQALNPTIQRLSARIDNMQYDSLLQRKSAEIMASSPGGIQFFDRDTDIEFAQHTPAIFVEFLIHQDIEKTSKELETLRLEVFGPITDQ